LQERGINGLARAGASDEEQLSIADEILRPGLASCHANTSGGK